jgi:hypothetical protein
MFDLVAYYDVIDLAQRELLAQIANTVRYTGNHSEYEYTLAWEDNHSNASNIR